ncbi:alpha/beta fold hydrolase [Nocardioides coralli]|uniref:alpha/beta fold hydrolase n=1 Tax=Nocardioides coralli TaxID=2872154 RepID=UPI001CA3C90E|nr:alpha/beta fold hydrolase [Nocardioides coralli]QZY28252.1 alpha/beta fold hydrolase [Nocardioides coralli]
MTDHSPSMTRHPAPGTTRGVVLMLHGGKARGHTIVDNRSASWRRSAAMARSIAGTAGEAGAAVWLLRYRHRGWNGGHGPVEDARWALDQVRAEHGEVPTVLLGHSMGARTSIHVADHPLVRGVVALAPWFTDAEPVGALAGKRLVAAHGSRDRITSARATRAFVQRVRSAGADAAYVDMGPVGHYMLRRVSAWNDVAVGRSLELLDSR